MGSRVVNALRALHAGHSRPGGAVTPNACPALRGGWDSTSHYCTPDCTFRGTWRTEDFKPYNFAALGQPTCGGHLHPLLKASAGYIPAGPVCGCAVASGQTSTCLLWAPYLPKAGMRSANAQPTCMQCCQQHCAWLIRQCHARCAQLPQKAVVRPPPRPPSRQLSCVVRLCALTPCTRAATARSGLSSYI